MTSAGRIDIDADDIIQALEANGFDDVRIDFAPDGGWDDGLERLAAVASVRRAAEAANVQAPGVWGERPAAGVGGASVRLKSPQSPDALNSWLAAFTAVLGAEGRSGLVRATRTVRLPGFVTGFTEPWITVFAAYDLAIADPATPPTAVSETLDALDLCRRAVAWTAQAGGEAYLSSGGMNQLVATDEAAAYLLTALHARSAASFTCVDAQAGRASHLHVDADGLVVYQFHDSSATPAERITRLRDAMTVDVERTRLAFAALSPVRAYGWDARLKGLPPLLEQPDGVLARNTPAWSEFVPDAHGVQLLTGRHLSRIPDLTGWTVRALTPDRSLVEAPDLAAWLAPGGPSEAELAQARAAFGAALLPGRLP